MKKTKKIILILLIPTLISGLAFLGINLGYIAYSSSFCYNSYDTVPARHVGLVLGCRPNSGLLLQRLHTIADLYRHGKIKFIIVSGAREEPDYMKNYLHEHFQIPLESIQCDYAGFRTLDSIIRAEAIFSQTDYIIVTQFWHTPRALVSAHAHRMDNVIAFNAPSYRFFRYLRTPPREYLARILSFFDLFFINRQPKYYGEKIEIPK